MARSNGCAFPPRAARKVTSRAGAGPAALKPSSAPAGASAEATAGEAIRTGRGVGTGGAGSDRRGRAGLTFRPSSGARFGHNSGSRDRGWGRAASIASGGSCTATATGGARTATAEEDWKFCASESSSALSIAVLTPLRSASGGAAQVGHSRMAGEHSWPHSGQIQYSIYIHSRTKVLLYL